MQETALAMTPPVDRHRKANVRLGLTLALIALVFGIGFVVRQVVFGG